MRGVLPLLFTAPVVEVVFLGWHKSVSLLCLVTPVAVIHDNLSYPIRKHILLNLYIYGKLLYNHRRAVLHTWPGLLLVVTGIYSHSQGLTRQVKYDIIYSPVLAVSHTGQQG